MTDMSFTDYLYAEYREKQRKGKKMKRDEFPIIDKHVKNEINAVLDNLRTEIEDERIDIDLDLGEEVYYNKAIDDVLQIIDKHREGEQE